MTNARAFGVRLQYQDDSYKILYKPGEVPANTPTGNYWGAIASIVARCQFPAALPNNSTNASGKAFELVLKPDASTEIILFRQSLFASADFYFTNVFAGFNPLAGFGLGVGQEIGVRAANIGYGLLTGAERLDFFGWAIEEPA